MPAPPAWCPPAPCSVLRHVCSNFLNRGGLSDSQDQPALGSRSTGLARVCQCACWHTRHTFYSDLPNAVAQGLVSSETSRAVSGRPYTGEHARRLSPNWGCRCAGIAPRRVSWTRRMHAAPAAAVPRAARGMTRCTADAPRPRRCPSGRTLRRNSRRVWQARDKSGGTPLLMAARRGHIACVQALLEGGSATNATNKDGYTALHHAANDGHFTCVTALVSAGARR